MKKRSIPILLLSLTITMLWNGCVKEIEDPTQLASNKSDFSTRKIPVTGRDAETPLKSTLTNFATEWIASSDKVGVYSAEARTTYRGNTPAVNMEFTAVSSGANSNFDGNMYWGEPGTSHTFYAYYPYLPGQPMVSCIPVTLPSLQVQQSANSTAHLGALDFLIATPSTVFAPISDETVGEAVNLHYNHLFTILEFQIKGTGALKAVKLATNTNLAFTSGLVDISQATPMAGTPYLLNSLFGSNNQIILSLLNSATLTSNSQDTKLFMVITPNIPSGNCVIGLSSDGTTWKYITKLAPTGGFKRSTKYVVQINSAEANDPKDGDGNSYSQILIGTQVWTSSNLKTTKYNDGSSIQFVTDNTTWKNLNYGGFCWYDNDQITNGENYGALYNWYVVDNNSATKVSSNGGKNVCPIGWHVPSDNDWTTLFTYLTNNNYGFLGGGPDISKSLAYNSLWANDESSGSPGNLQQSNNTSGFSAIPGGYRFGNDWDGSFSGAGILSIHWSTTESSLYNGWERVIDFSMDTPDRAITGKEYGLSVRCLKD